MPGFTHNDPPREQEILARHAARLNRCWSQVRVNSVQITPGTTGDRIQALVQLGGLTPADVRVELMPMGSGDGITGGSSDELRMFSVHDLANGCFAFEATPRHRDSAQPQDWMIHVHPSEALEEPRVEYRFCR